MNKTPLGSIVAQIREFFLLERAERDSASLTASQVETIRSYQTAASGRLDAAQDLRGPAEVRAALTLYRDGALLLALAVLVAKEQEKEPAALTPKAAVGRLDSALAALEPPVELGAVKTVWESDDPMALDKFSADEAARLAEELETATRWLASLVYAPTARQLKINRITRVLGASIGGIVLFVLLGYWIFSPKNVAAGKPATASSLLPSALTTTAGAVDGTKNGKFGFHSAEEDAPWLSIDLGKSYPIGTVKVFGRGDCCTDQSVPLALEVSDDGTAFRGVANRNEPFSESSPWVVKLDGVGGRFVRLRTLRRSYLVLSEVEVYTGKWQAGTR